MISMRLPESETTKVLVPVAARSAPVLSKAAPVQVPPEYRLKLYLPNPVVGSNVLVPTSVRRFTAALNGVPTTGASDSVKTPQEFPAASRVNCSTRVELNGTTFGAVAQSATAVKPELKQIVKNPLPLPANVPARLASLTPPSLAWARLTLTEPPIIVAMKSSSPSPIAPRSFIMA